MCADEGGLVATVLNLHPNAKAKLEVLYFVQRPLLQNYFGHKWKLIFP